ncbi:MAG: hypothetical protein M3312_07480, partial [Actinomycetota bacterium]|nr:hypothetical protein [Actinomycetota bacterium]
MTETISIEKRFNGPPNSANGGYAAGLFAALVGGKAEVMLRRPPPLDEPLEVVRSRDSVAEVRHGGALVAEAVPVDVELEVPEPPSLDETEQARTRYAGFDRHAYPTCFTCGPERLDGLRIFPGPVARRALVAAPWLPPPGDVPPEVVWAALDCPGGWAIDTFNREGVLLGTIAAKVDRVEGGEPHLVVGWARGTDGRKRYAGSAIFSAGGELSAYARSTWLVP